MLVILPGEPYLQTMPTGAETHSKTPTKSGTKSRTQSGTKSGTQGYKFSGQRILKSYQAIYFLKIEDPETIPGNILTQDRGS